MIHFAPFLHHESQTKLFSCVLHHIFAFLLLFFFMVKQFFKKTNKNCQLQSRLSFPIHVSLTCGLKIIQFYGFREGGMSCSFLWKGFKGFFFFLMSIEKQALSIYRGRHVTYRIPIFIYHSNFFFFGLETCLIILYFSKSNAILDPSFYLYSIYLSIFAMRCAWLLCI